MRKKLVPLIAIAFVIAAISTAIFYSLFAIRLSGAPAPGSSQKVIVAARDLTPGTVLTEQDLSTMSWAGAQIPHGAYSASGKVAGKTVVQTIALGEPVLESRLAAKDVTGLGIPEGMRAVSVHVSDSSGVVGMLRPGCKVDIQVFGWRSRKAANTEGMRTLLRGAPVLSVNTQPEPSSQGYFGAPVVTLLAQAADAEQLAMADSFARLRLTLRNPLEPASPVSAPTAATGVRLHVKAVALSGDGLSALASRLDSHLQPNVIGLATVHLTDPDALAQLLKSTDYSRKQAESLVVAPLNQTSWFELPAAAGHARIGFSPSSTAEMRIDSEVTGMWGGRVETHSVETKLPAEPGRVIVISGLEGTATDGKFPHLVVLVTPEKITPSRTPR